MRGTQKLFSIISIFALLSTMSLAQDSIRQQSKKQTVVPAASSNPVVGSGSSGQITKWTGIEGANTFTIGNSNIFEDKFGKVGIGTKTPTSLLTVQGMIETTLGGYKFPDGTVQTTAFNPNQVVRSLNGLTGNVILAAGTNITITPSGNTLTIAATNALTSVTHNATLQGNGTAASPLGVALPLTLSGLVDIAPLLTVTNSGAGDGILASCRDGIGVRGHSDNSVGVLGESGGIFPGVRGVSDSGEGVSGFSNSGDGVHGTSNGSGVGVKGEGGTGVQGAGSLGDVANGGIGVQGSGGGTISDGGSGVEGTGGSGGFHGGSGVRGVGGTGISAIGGDGLSGVGGIGSGAGNFGGAGIAATKGSAILGAAEGLAGRFFGNVDIIGKLTKTMGTFKIDHPLDPENKYLYHSFVESPDMMNIYNGNITTDPNGDAVVEMPDYFDALNKDFRYQLTVIGTFAQAIVATEMKDNRFVIKTNAPNVKVSWQITGVRHDAFADKNRIQVEETKSERERGYYLHPEVFNQPEEKSVEWARNPDLMLKLKQQRVEAEAKIQKQQQR